MPDDAITFREDVIEKSMGGTGHDIVVRHQYEQPMASDTEAADDPHAEMDMANCRWMMDILQRHYRGHLWRVKHDGAQRMAYVSIPILMGINRYWAINLVTDALTEGLVVRCGGAILERYGLSRERFNLASFLEAREKYSALVVPKRIVPE